MKTLKDLFRRWKLAGMLATGVVSLQSWCNPIEVQHIRNGEVIGVYKTLNGITNEGINNLLDVHFGAEAQITDWYMGLVNNSGFSAFADTDTMNSHSGWSEFTTYNESDRPAWAPSSASNRSISNSSSVDFSITGSGTIKGIFVVSDDTKSGTSGTLWATAAFASNVAVINGDVLKVTYTVSG